MPQVIIPGVLVALFILFIARPAATFSILSWFKVPVKQQLFVSWVGLRGAASIVFAIFAVNEHVNLSVDIFHMVFFVALFSVLSQGSLTTEFARKLDLVEESTPALKTFTDYTEETHTRLLEYPIGADSILVGKAIMDANIPEEILIVMVKRGGDVVLPKGSTILCEGDILVLSGNNLDAFAIQ
jgi:cell volume regulation protein A